MNASDIIALTFSIISLVSSVLSYLLILKPALVAEMIDTPNDRICLKIKNQGARAADIRQLNFSYKGKEICQVNKKELFIDVMSEKSQNQLFMDKSKWKNYQYLDYLAPNESICLFEMSTDYKATTDDINRLRAYLQDSGISIKINPFNSGLRLTYDVDLSYFGHKLDNSSSL